jgi:hypothetical protein
VPSLLRRCATACVRVCGAHAERFRWARKRGETAAHTGLPRQQLPLARTGGARARRLPTLTHLWRLFARHQRLQRAQHAQEGGAFQRQHRQRRHGLNL